MLIIQSALQNALKFIKQWKGFIMQDRKMTNCVFRYFGDAEKYFFLEILPYTRFSLSKII